VVALGSNDFDIYRLGSALNTLGWNLNVLQFPSGIHICVTHVHTQQGVADKFLNDVQNSVAEILKEPDVPVEGKVILQDVVKR
jgi:sphinganine-1-phosphate aldolase